MTTNWPPEGTEVRQDWAATDHDKCGVVLTGAPSVLAGLCARLGLKNDCRKGSIYITGAKVRRLKGAR